MKCDMCGEREASVFLTQMYNNEIKKLHLCEKCAIANGLDLKNAISLTDALLGTSKQIKSEIKKEKNANKYCPFCKMTYSDFRKRSRFGCPKCYETFQEELEVILKDMHSSTRHTGKKPISTIKNNTISEVTESIEELKCKLFKAIESENYEEAAIIRDQLKHLSENKLKCYKYKNNEHHQNKNN